MKELKITRGNWDLLASGVKTLEIRAREKIRHGAYCIFIDNKTGEKLGKVYLEHYWDYNEYTTLAQRPFWKPWVEHYLAKGETPAFYDVEILEEY